MPNHIPKLMLRSTTTPGVLLVFAWAAMTSPVSASTGSSDLKIAGRSYERQEARANSFVQSTQESVAVALYPDGGIVVVWDSRRQEQGTYGVYLQRYSAVGQPIGGELHVNVHTRSMQSRPSVAIDGLGATWVAWESFAQDGSMGAIVARRFNENFSKSTNEIMINQTTVGDQSDVVVVADAQGNATFVWTTPARSKARPSLRHVVARRFDAQGKPLGAEFRMSQSGHGGENLPSVAIDGRNRVIVVWAQTDHRGRPTTIRARILGADGAPVTAELPVSPADARMNIEPSVSAAADGKFAVAWLTATGEDYVVSVRKFDAAGRPLTPCTRVSRANDKYVSGAAVGMAPDGRFAVSWNAESGQARGTDVFARFYDAVGGAASGVEVVNRHTKGDQNLAGASGKQRVVWGGDDRLAIAWAGDSGLGDKSAANITVLVPKDMKYKLVSRVRSRATRSDRAGADGLGAAPHEPPTFDPSTISDDPFGGDTDPTSDGGDFGFIGITNSGWTPPDPHLAAGPNHVIVITNGAIAFFQKNGTKDFQDEIENS
ncbi:MAG: hypothetical protein IID39_10610, partial [Planctomycetes bacterium]|nr:hypothetical protein [Planctomycetota bacterium]